MDKQAYYVCKSCGEKYVVTYPSQPKPPQNIVCPVCGCRSFEVKTDKCFTSSIGGKF